jgi:hypothetical protein
MGRVAEASNEDTVRVSTPELSFDLVFVFAFTQLTGVLADEMTARGAPQVLLTLGVIWWMYGGCVWLTNAVGTDRAARRMLLLGGMVISAGDRSARARRRRRTTRGARRGDRGGAGHGAPCRPALDRLWPGTLIAGLGSALHGPRRAHRRPHRGRDVPNLDPPILAALSRPAASPPASPPASPRASRGHRPRTEPTTPRHPRRSVDPG